MTKKPIPYLKRPAWHTHPARSSQAYDALVGFHEAPRGFSSAEPCWAA
jgi:hypothetical protein